VITDLHVDAFKRAATPEGQKAFDLQRTGFPRDIRARIRQLLETLKKNNPDFVVITGDSVNFVEASNLAALEDEIKRSGLQVYWVPGNHDRRILGSEGEAISAKGRVFFCSDWKDCAPYWSMAGGRPLSASFEKNGRCFVFLDDSDGKFKEPDLKAAGDFLDRHSDCRAFVFFHIPLFGPNERRQAIKTLGPWTGPPFISGKVDIMEPSPIFLFLKHYENRIAGIFAGHIHSLAEDDWNGKFRQITLESAFENGMYAFVDCDGKKPCRVNIRKAL
jgi:3',5'-cyclic AMP phosphodiesterase CpdA